MLRTSSTAIAAGIVIVFSCSTVGLAQTTGTILGQVNDLTNAAMANAAVQAENTDTGLTRKALTNSEGTYLIPSLPPGTYKITMALVQNEDRVSDDGTNAAIRAAGRAVPWSTL